MSIESILTVEVVSLLASSAATAAGIAYVVRTIRKSGKDRIVDPKRVASVVKSAPYKKMGNIISKPVLRVQEST